MNNKTKSHLAVVGANLIFGANYSVVKYISPRLTGPFALNLLRVSITVFLFWLMFILKPSVAGIKKHHTWRFILCGLTGVVINQLCFIKGLTLTSPIHASLLMLGTPILITVFAVWFAGEKFTPFKTISLMLGIGGALLLILQKEQSGIGKNVLLGDILCTINGISYAIFIIMAKPLMTEYTPIHVIRWIFTFGALFIIPFGANELLQINWSLFHGGDYLSLAFIVVGATFVAYYFNSYSLSHLNPSVIGAYIYMQPVCAAIIAMLFLGEALTWQKVLAAFLIFSGVYLTNKVK